MFLPKCACIAVVIVVVLFPALSVSAGSWNGLWRDALNFLPLASFTATDPEPGEGSELDPDG